MSGGVAVIVATTGGERAIGASVAGFAREVSGRGEVVLVDGSRLGVLDPRLDDVRVIRGGPRLLVPQLWAIGLEQSDAPLVAFTTASMVPQPGWLSRLRSELDRGDCAGVGGGIVPSRDLSAFDEAVFLHRYLSNLPPLTSRSPAGENALYRRDRLPPQAGGFWEAAVHEEMRRRGERFTYAEDATVEYQGEGTGVEFLSRRWDHARIFGAWRSAGWSPARRIASVAAAPMVPSVLGLRIARRLGAGRWSPGPSCLTWLGLLLTLWAAGEAVGMALGPPHREERAERFAEPLAA